jgi:hypothetical protein
MPIFDPQPELAVVPPSDYGQVSAKRQRLLADALRKKAEVAGPQGQMVSGHYVAPSWSQHLGTIASGAASGYMEGKAQEAEDASTRQIAEARKGVMSNLPQAVEAQYGQKISGLGGREKMETYETSPAKPLQRAEVFKKYAEMMEVPGMEKTATAYLNSAQSEIQREDLQVEAQRKQKDDIERRREEAERHSNDLARQDLARSQDKERDIEYKKERDRADAQLRRELAANRSGEKKGTENSAQAKERQGVGREVDSSIVREDTLKEMAEILPGATGSAVGTGVDAVLGTVGIGLPGAKASARLKALEGTMLGNVPKFSGSTSNQDVKDYKQAVGEIANSTLPVSVRMEALETVRFLARKGFEQAQRKAADYNTYADAEGRQPVIVPDYELTPLTPRSAPASRSAAGKVTPGAVAGAGQPAAPVAPAERAVLGVPKDRKSALDAKYGPK